MVSKQHGTCVKCSVRYHFKVEGMFYTSEHGTAIAKRNRIDHKLVGIYQPGLGKLG